MQSRQSRNHDEEPFAHVDKMLLALSHDADGNLAFELAVVYTLSLSVQLAVMATTHWIKLVLALSCRSRVLYYEPINGMPHLAYLGQMLEKEGEFGIGIFPEGLVLSQDCQNES